MERKRTSRLLIGIAIGVFLTLCITYGSRYAPIPQEAVAQVSEANDEEALVLELPTTTIRPIMSYRQAVMAVEAVCISVSGKFCADVINSDEEYEEAIAKAQIGEKFQLNLSFYFEVPKYFESQKQPDLPTTTST